VGACYLRLGEIDSARYYFEREKRFNPERFKASLNMASLYLVEKQYDSALSEVRQALAAKPYDVTVNMVRLRAAFALSSIDRDSLAILVMQAADNTGDDIYLLTEAATLLTERGGLEQAESVLLRALQVQPPPIETDDKTFSRTFRNSPQKWSGQRARAYYQLGYICGLRGAYQDAVRYSSLAIQGDSSLAEAYVNIISGLVSIGQTQQAEAVLAIALRKFPAGEPFNRVREFFDK
jgi:tetratricopeptide (TPR) repeat protein